MKIAGITLGVVILLVSFLFYILSLMKLVPSHYTQLSLIFSYPYYFYIA